MTDRKIIAYRLEPVYEPRSESIGTAAVMTCMATGKMLSGSGGGGSFLAPEIVDVLRNDGTSKTIIAAAYYDAMVAALKAVTDAYELRLISNDDEARFGTLSYPIPAIIKTARAILAQEKI